MTQVLFPDNELKSNRKIKCPVISDTDGVREGALTFPIVLILGFIAASVADPGMLSSFWVWYVLLMMSVCVAQGVQRAVAWLYCHEVEDAE